MADSSSLNIEDDSPIDNSNRIMTTNREEDGNTANTAQDNGNDDAVELPRWYPHWYNTNRPIYHGNPEVLGWALDASGRAVSFIGAGAFLGTALLKLAKEAAGCDVEQDEECDKRVYGIFRPSSLLTTYTIVVGVASAAFLPLMGAIVDYTPHRRIVGRWLSVIFCILLFPQIFVSDKTWFAVALLQIGVAFVGWAQTMVTYAYLPELTSCEDRLNQYTQSFTIVSFGSMVVYLSGVVALAAVWGLSDVATARLGQAISFVVSSVCLYMAWGHLLRRRPPARSLPDDCFLWTAGFHQIYHTSIHIYQNFAALKWFYISVALIDAAINSFATIMITYTTDTLGFSTTENGITILFFLLGSIPGALLAGKTLAMFNPIFSALLATFLLMGTTVTCGVLLHQPGQHLVAYLLALAWGVGTGSKWTTDRFLASVLIPPGQDAELMGVYLFAGQVFTWFPPLLFTILNEAGVSQRIGIATLSLYFGLGSLATLAMGKYDDAVAQREAPSVSVDPPLQSGEALSLPMDPSENPELRKEDE